MVGGRDGGIIRGEGEILYIFHYKLVHCIDRSCNGIDAVAGGSSVCFINECHQSAPSPTALANGAGVLSLSRSDTSGSGPEK